ncbi:MAG: hypothetical protein ACE5DI_00885 [Candidatus Micrarchaeia archaeon]
MTEKEFPLAKIATVGAVAFLTAFALLIFLTNTQEYNVEGVRVISSKKPAIAFPDALTEKNVTLQADFRSVEDIECISSMLTQVSLGLGASNKNVLVEAKTGEKCISLEESQKTCAEPNILISHGECNCVKINEQVIIEGNDEFLCKNSEVVGSMISYALGGTTVPQRQADEILKEYRESLLKNQTKNQSTNESHNTE